MELVKLVMEIYYNLIRLQELEENNFVDNKNASVNRNENNNTNNNSTKNPTSKVTTRSPPSAYYANHSNNEQQRSSSRLFNSNHENDSIYMNNSCLNSSFNESKQTNKQQQQQTKNDAKLTSAMKNMEALNFNDNEADQNDYINKLIDEINKNANRRGIKIKLNILRCCIFFNYPNYLKKKKSQAQY